MDNNEEFVSIESIINDKKFEEIKRDKLIERIQISLIIILVVVGTLTYFFCYDLLEPFIKVDMM